MMATIKRCVFKLLVLLFKPINKLISYHFIYIRLATVLDRFYSFWIQNECKQSL